MQSEQQSNTLRRNTLHPMPQLFRLMDQNSVSRSRFMNGTFARHLQCINEDRDEWQ